MPRMVRRKPWAERVKAMLNPMDFLLWVSEELETRDWDSKALGTKLGLAFNFIFLIARANCAASEAHDDVSDQLTSWNTAKELPTIPSPPAPVTDAQRRKEQRRQLRESGDYLGVQGINPSTGELDTMTSSSGSQASYLDEELRQKLLAVKRRGSRALRAHRKPVNGLTPDDHASILQRERQKLLNAGSSSTDVLRARKSEEDELPSRVDTEYIAELREPLHRNTYSRGYVSPFAECHASMKPGAVYVSTATQTDMNEVLERKRRHRVSFRR
ncbi:hypothetical protein BN1708_011327 [Verticillium longisporum]|uniref:Uncharacterized protein n=1 Tax=Verticillium longisporum TaxID=100787 RepID=A0A0G4KZ54_VERLO|nr:hypothetical protein BN1708_011327 [Verticillium longisporum]